MASVLDLDNLTGYRWTTPSIGSFGSEYRVKLARTIPKPKLIDDKRTAQAGLAALEGAEWTAVDTEFDPDTSEMVTWQFSTGNNRFVVDHTAGATRHFKRWLASDARKIYSDAYADIPIFQANGIEVGGDAGDTVVLDWLVDENRFRHGLKTCVNEWLGIPMCSYDTVFAVIPPGRVRGTTLKPQVVWNDPKWRDRFVEYGSLDAYGTYWLFQHHRRVLKKLKLWQYYLDYELPFTRALIDIAQRGIRIDRPVLDDIGRELDKVITRCSRIFRALAPPISVERVKAGESYYEDIEPADINLKSPPQLAALFYDSLGCKSIEDKESTDARHLKLWASEGNMLARLLLEHRRAAKQRNTFVGEVGGKGLISFMEAVRDAYGEYFKVCTRLKQAGTVTGRLSSSAPNLQNIPNRKDKDPYRMRRAFVARPGCKLIVADYSGAELRVMAHYSQDKRMIKAFANGWDLHSLTAKRIFGLTCKLDQVKDLHPDKRNRAKAVNFGLQYGMQAWLLSEQLGVSEEEAQRYLDAYFDYYSGVYRWMIGIVTLCRKQGYVETILGRRRRLPDIRSDDRGSRRHAERQAMNTPIQGTVADIIKVAMTDIERSKWMRDHEVSLLLQVHDELVLEAPEIDAHVAAQEVKAVMEGAAKAVGLTVELPAEPGVADDWEHAKV